MYMSHTNNIKLCSLYMLYIVLYFIIFSLTLIFYVSEHCDSDLW